MDGVEGGGDCTVLSLYRISVTSLRMLQVASGSVLGPALHRHMSGLVS